MDYIFIDHLKNIKLRDIAYKLSKLNDINLIKVNEHSHYHSIDGVSIVNGDIYYINDNSFNIVLHEMCHILIVEPEYRELVHGDTNESYKSINKQYPLEINFRKESITFGLQQLLYNMCDISTDIYGDFFTGSIGVDCFDVYPEWIDIAKNLNHVNLNIEEIFPNKHIEIHSSIIEPKSNEKLLVLLWNATSNSYEMKESYYEKGYYMIDKQKYNSYNISKWTYLI